MGLEQLMDGARCTGVLVEGEAEAVAAFLTAACELCGGEPRVLIADMRESGWCRVEFGEQVEASQRMIDSDPLLDEAISAMLDEPTSGRIGTDTPVRAARMLSEGLGVSAVGIWGSDQGPGIGGAVRFDAGQRAWCFSAASPEAIEMIDQLRGVEEADDELSEDLEAVLDEIDEREQEQCWSQGGSLGGHVSDHVDKALSDSGIDPDWLEEPVWSLMGMSPLPSELRRIVRVP